MKKVNYFIALIILVSITASCGVSKKMVDNRTIKEKIESQRFVFKANYAIPTSAGFQPRYLSSEYDLKVTPDTIIVFLPYFGRPYEAPMGISDGGIKFESTDFDYNLTNGKKADNWIVNIKVKDQKRFIYLVLEIWENGKGNLNVRDESRQPISFNGEIE